jgi:hypothetical protein
MSNSSGPRIAEARIELTARRGFHVPLSCPNGHLMPRAVIESFIILQSLTGIGHLARCSAIANALSSISTRFVSKMGPRAEAGHVVCYTITSPLRGRLQSGHRPVS